MAMAKALESCDWNIFEIHKSCDSCRKHNVFDGKFCTYCGAQLRLKDDTKPIEELSSAFMAGLKVHNESM